MADDKELEKNFAELLVSKIPKSVWAVTASMFAIMFTLNMLQINLGYVINTMANAYAEDYKRRSELNLKSQIELEKSYLVMIKNVNALIDRIEKLEKNSHPFHKKSRKPTR